MDDVPKEVATAIGILAGLAPACKEIWLIGSRANGSFRDDSDWDLLIFGSTDLISAIREHRELKKREIDLLVVFDGDSFRDPFRKKRGSLRDWKWSRKSEHEARYVGVKFFPDQNQVARFGCEMGEISEKEMRARLLWQGDA